MESEAPIKRYYRTVARRRPVHRDPVHLLYYWLIRAVRAAGTAVPATSNPHRPAAPMRGSRLNGRRAMDSSQRARIGARDRIPIVVVLYHREDDTRRMFEQLARVTDNYSRAMIHFGSSL